MSSEADRLEAEILLADDAYFNGAGDSGLSDERYDEMRRRLEELRPDSKALRRVGAPVRRGRMRLPVYMGSLNKRVGAEDMGRWLATHPGPYLVTDKLDGVSGLLEVDRHGRRRMLTRGDGTVGEDVSFLLAALTLPAHLPACRVRGELILPRSAAAELPGFKNLRAAVAGTVNSASVSARREEVLRRLKFVPYALMLDEEPDLPPSAQFVRLLSWGFECPFMVPLNTDGAELPDLLAERRARSPYDVDGLVIAQNVPHRIVPGKNPEHAVAFKSRETQETAEAEVTEVVWEVSKDGLLKPTVRFTPVELGGVTITRASGQNARFISEYGVGVGAQVRVTRSGDVIPYILAVKRCKGGEPAMPPEGTWTWNASGVEAVAVGDSAEQQVRLMEHFFSTVGARGLSSKTLARMHAAGFTTVDAVLAATPADLQFLGARTAEKLVREAQRAVAGADAATLLVARNVFGRGLGEKRLRAVLAAVPDLMQRSADEPGLRDRLRSLPGMADKTADQVLAALAQKM